MCLVCRVTNTHPRSTSAGLFRNSRISSSDSNRSAGQTTHRSVIITLPFLQPLSQQVILWLMGTWAVQVIQHEYLQSQSDQSCSCGMIQNVTKMTQVIDQNNSFVCISYSECKAL